MGFDGESDLLIDLHDDNKKWRDRIPYRLQKGLEEIHPDVILVQNGKPLILFFDVNTRSEDRGSIAKKIWNMGSSAVIFFFDNDTVTIYNGQLFDTETSTFDKLYIDGEKVDKLDYWDVLSGKLWSKLSRIDAGTRVDESLLNNIQVAQEVLIEDGLSGAIANNLIGRLLFARYLLDRKVYIGGGFYEDNSQFLRLISNKAKLYAFFDYLKTTFNGDLFPVEDGEEKHVKNSHLDLLQRLFRGDEIATGQISLFDHYDFRIIPIELISEVYERFIGSDRQRKEGAYYTPAFLVDYILEKTVKLSLKSKASCKVLDPSCGSGIFLVEALRSIIEAKKALHGYVNQDELTKLAKENIYGVDKDDNAVNLTIFSLYLTLLDYQEPKDITSFKFPNLKNSNIFTSDFFDMENDFNGVLREVKFDHILGNPPWKSDASSELHVDYYTHNAVPVSDKQIAQTFTARVKDFTSTETKIALILTSKILYNHNALAFRQYFNKNFFIDEVLELSPVRKHLFKGATAPSVVVFYRYANGAETSRNELVHTSLKPNIFLKQLGLIVIEKNDRKVVEQCFFAEYDWLWKIMLYGNIFDFHFIKRLKENYPNINTYIDAGDVKSGVGLKRVDGKKKTNVEFIIGKKFIDLSTKDLKRYNVGTESTWVEKYVGNMPQKGVFDPPYVLIKRGFQGATFKQVSTYSEQEYIFTDSVTSVFGKDKVALKSFTGFLNSSLHSYFLLHQGSYAGVEREKALDGPERFEFPVVVDESISSQVDEIMNVVERKYSKVFHDANLEAEIERLEEKLDKTVYGSMDVTHFEQKLIDYALNVSVPLFNGKKTPYSSASKLQLEKYAEVFTEHFNTLWSKRNLWVRADVYATKMIVGINFNVVRTKPDLVISFIKDDSVIQRLSKAIKLGVDQISERVFVQRDIRGFQEQSFFVAKPNEYKNWHESVASIDLHEFLAEMMSASRRSGDS